MDRKSNKYIPALSYGWLTHLYDPVMQLFMRESTFKRRLVAQARTKIMRAGLDIKLDLRMSFELPYPDNSYDRVVSSLVFHHLARENKVRTFKEIFRVLKPGGELQKSLCSMVKRLSF